MSSFPTRSKAARSLRARARKGIVKYSALEARLQRAVLLYWGSMKQARTALGLLEPRPPRQKWSRARVIAEIKQLHRAGLHMSSLAVARAGRSDLVLAATQYAGGWSRARALAGIRFQRKRSEQGDAWDAAAVVAAIQDRRAHDKSLAVTKSPTALVSAANRIFGSWREAVTAAGFDYADVMLTRKYDDEEILHWLRMLSRTDPDMSLFDLDKHGEHAVLCRRRWGSYEAAAKAAGIVGWPRRLRTPALSKVEVIRALRGRRRRRQPLDLASVRASERGYFLINSAFHHFRTWSAALEAAGG